MLTSAYFRLMVFLDKFRSLSPLIFRLLLVWGFYEPAMNKLQNPAAIMEWFSEMGLPFPWLQTWLAIITECAGCLLLFFGLGTRIIVVPLIIVLLVAIKKVHLENGFSAANNGYEIPFYYLLMLISLLLTGSGKFSLDYLLNRKMSYRKDFP